jgi:hypothetical protein
MNPNASVAHPNLTTGREFLMMTNFRFVLLQLRKARRGINRRVAAVGGPLSMPIFKVTPNYFEARSSLFVFELGDGRSGSGRGMMRE